MQGRWRWTLTYQSIVTRSWKHCKWHKWRKPGHWRKLRDWLPWTHSWHFLCTRHRWKWLTLIEQYSVCMKNNVSVSSCVCRIILVASYSIHTYISHSGWFFFQLWDLTMGCHRTYAGLLRGHCCFNSQTGKTMHTIHVCMYISRSFYIHIATYTHMYNTVFFTCNVY